MDTKKELINFISDKGFIYGPEPEIYGGLAGFYTYGPLGKTLKNKIEKVIRDTFVRYDLWEVECPTVMPAPVWKASGHLDGFTDPLIRDVKGNIFRADNLIEEWCQKEGKSADDLGLDGASHEKLLSIFQEHGIKAPNGNDLVMEITNHNLMMRTTIGHDTEAYNRPETATTTYLPFMRYLQFFRQKLPFGVFQIGKAYRNEISPRQHVLRCREFTQAEGQLFILKEQKDAFEPFAAASAKELPLWSYQLQDEKKSPAMMSLQDALQQGVLKNQAYAWTLNLAYELFVNMGIPKEKIRMRQHHLDERAFYADDAWDVEIEFSSFGWTEVCGIHDRTDYDLSTHAKHSKTPLVVTREDGTKEVPHVLEIAFGTDRPTFAILDLFFKPAEKGEGKPSFLIPYHLAPVEVAVFPLVNKDGIPELAQQVYGDLQKHFSSRYDRSGAIGKRYLRADEIGTAFCVTVDHDSLEDKSVTLRDRDSAEQKRVKIENLASILQGLMSGMSSFAKL